MRLRCIYNTVKDLPLDVLTENSNHDVTRQFDVKISKEYIVYAMTIKNNYVWYFICNKNFSDYPSWLPCPLFEIIDKRLSKYWIFSFSRQTEKYYSQTIWAYPDWANDPGYYENLLDGEKKERESFYKYKELMDLEFRDSSITDSAEEIDSEWILCPFCVDAWQEFTKSEIVICPKCCKKMINPHIKLAL